MDALKEAMMRAEDRGNDPYLFPGPAIISFSGGRSSGYMLKHILDARFGVLPNDIKVVFCNTGREMPETLDFVQECSSRWDVPIVWLEFDPAAEHRTKIVSHNSASRNGEPFAAVIQNRKMLPNPVTRFCTVELKIRRSYSYAFKVLGWDTWTAVIGFRGDEMSRVNKMGRRKDRWTEIAPMADAEVSKRDVMLWWDRQPFDLRLPNINGSTPQGNCDLCFLKGQATIRGLIRNNPELATWWIGQEVNAPGLKTMRNPAMALFRADRASYAAMLHQTQTQSDWIFDKTYESDRDCNCTD